MPIVLLMYCSKPKFSQFKSKAKKRGLSAALTYEQFCFLKQGSCEYCSIQLEFIQLHCHKQGIKTPYMTIDRKNNAVGYVWDNCVSCCFVCNRIKGSFFTSDEMKQIGQLFVKPKWDSQDDDVWEDYLGNIP